MRVSSSESHNLTAFYEMLTASFGVLSQNTGFYPSLDRIVETMLGPLNLGPGGGSYNEPISHLHQSLWPTDLSEAVLESRQSSSQRWTETVHPVQRVQSENGKWTKGFCDILVDFQTGEIPSTGWIYIYTFVN